MVSKAKIKIGLRGSNLSLTQGRIFSDLLASSFESELEVIKTSGDIKSEKFGEKLVVARDKVDWIKEIEESLLSGRVDVALHSAKDVPVEVDSSTELIPLPSPASRFDVLVASQPIGSIEDLPESALIGTSSDRRASQLLALNSKFQIVETRGNVETRLSNLSKLNLDAIVLAEAGLERLELSPDHTLRLNPPMFLPAINQGILSAQIRKDSRELRAFVEGLIGPEDWGVFLSERACVRKLGADCKSAVGVYAHCPDSSSIDLVCRVNSSDGQRVLEAREVGSIGSPEELGIRLASELLEQGAEELL